MVYYMKLKTVPECCSGRLEAAIFHEQPEQRASHGAAAGRRRRGPMASEMEPRRKGRDRSTRARAAFRPAVSRIWWSLAIAVATAGLAALSRCNTGTLTLLRCPLFEATGIHCPVCGVTRATQALLHGRVLESLRFNTLWVVSIPLLLYIATSEIWFSFGGSGPCFWSPSRHPWFYAIAMAIVAVFFLLRNLPWYPMALLAPPGT